jgi:2-methylcitrate dehydratase PrpD
VIYGQVLGTAFDERLLTDRPGEHFLITDNFMKCHASCRETHGAIAALTKALGHTKIEPEQIQRVDIETFAEAARLSDTNPVNEMAARFSIPAVVAAIILDCEVGAVSLSSERVQHPTFRALMQRVSVTEAVDATQALPAQRICRCQVVLTDGTLLSAQVVSAPGDAADPLAIDVLRKKLDVLCGRSRQEKDRMNVVHELRALLG